MNCGSLMKEKDTLKTDQVRDFPGGPVVKNLPASAGDTGSSPGLGTKIPYPLEVVARNLRNSCFKKK